ncbi:cobyrinic acid a,c-diamide synthase [Halobacteroides halobius DSM 5150]|uniref:Cobyrinate a,c-diamide synthase n=1 Tax=Halobacteroides halobius (strain ATCC 35273 / DSM 5150 / MD-1) TaxID=748449 RepID=L0KAS0_HALHC|nr:cobyrinate a,c-diamide synthase [Halobacteroides halobius]AGB41640.1 cobyrinic acid a,c-diamide synthase [Halobacteroides halobius DSM 5150]
MNPRVVIAGTESGVGKTTVTIGLMAALDKQGYNVQPYKVGPDYIDPGFHTLVTGNQSRNLDSFFLGEEGVKESFLNAGGESDISIIEGVMGLFDGKKGTDGAGSTAHIAKILETPVVLVMDVKKMARSAVALAYGYQNFDADLNIAGIILNNVGSKGHFEMIKKPLEEEVGVKVLGYLPYQKDLELPERHLGLVPTFESKELANFRSQLVELIEKYIDLEQLVSLSQEGTGVEVTEKKIFTSAKDYNLTLGVAYDEAFNFYYQDNFDLLASRGVDLKFFSPIEDNKLPKVDGLYIGGGFPESFLQQLVNNKSIKQDIYRHIREDLPTYAECGGLMYLTEEIIDNEGKRFPMVGAVSGQVKMTDSLQAMGYVDVKAVRDNILLKQGEKAKGHEFHYSKLINLADESKQVYQLYGGRGEEGRLEGIVRDNLLVSYVHLHFGSQPKVINRFLGYCQKYKRGS